MSELPVGFRIFDSSDPAHYRGAEFWRVVVESMGPGVLGFVRRLLRIGEPDLPPAGAEDVVQDSWQAVWRRVDAERIARQPTAEGRRMVFRGYLYTTAFRLASRRMADWRNERAVVSTAYDIDQIRLPAPVDEQLERDGGLVWRAATREQLQSFVNRLTAKQRRILYLHYVQGLSWAQVAAMAEIGMSEQALRVMACRLMRRLRTSAQAVGIVVLKEKRS